MEVTLILPHDFRFSQWSVQDFIDRYHFSKQYLETLEKRGIKASLYCLHQSISEIYNVNNIFFYPIDFRLPPLVKFGNDFSIRLMEELPRNKPDICHVFNYYVWCYPWLINRLNSSKIPVIAQFHGTVDNFSTYKLILFRHLVKKTNLFLIPFVSEAMKLAKTLKISIKKIKLFPNVGVSLEIFKPYDKSSDPTILYVGRFPNNAGSKWEKNPFLVIRLFEILRKKIPQLKLLMVGDGPGLSKIMNYAKKSRFSRNVLFMGHIKYHCLPLVYSRAWLTIIPFYFPEMTYLWDGSLKESLACGTPVVIFGDCFKLTRWGVMLPYNNIDKFTESIVAMLSHYETYFDDVNYIRKMLAKVCSWETLSKRLIYLYEKIIEGNTIEGN
jgi:glycosyltransferase involved in cell wall biosynthesis